ncbi:MAG: SMC-Scp complex subunit ScpB [Candidatus Ozemobacteraceae bacterium]
MSTAHVDDSGDFSPSHLHGVQQPERLPTDGISLKAAIEGLLFVQNQAVTFESLAELLGMQVPVCQELVMTVKAAFDADKSRGLQLVINEQGVQLATKAAISSFIQRLDGQKLTNLSLPALETLSVIAFKAPITKAEIEAIRGVNCDGVVQTLLEKKLVYVSGEKPVIGRPRLYCTTQDFLYYFGLKSLKELPVPSVEMPDAESLKEIEQQLGGQEAEGQNGEDGDAGNTMSSDAGSGRGNAIFGDGVTEGEVESAPGLDGAAESKEESASGLDGAAESKEESASGLDVAAESKEESASGLDVAAESKEESASGLDVAAERKEESAPGLDVTAEGKAGPAFSDDAGSEGKSESASGDVTVSEDAEEVVTEDDEEDEEDSACERENESSSDEADQDESSSEIPPGRTIQ